MENASQGCGPRMSNRRRPYVKRRTVQPETSNERATTDRNTTETALSHLNRFSSVPDKESAGQSSLSPSTTESKCLPETPLPQNRDNAEKSLKADPLLVISNRNVLHPHLTGRVNPKSSHCLWSLPRISNPCPCRQLKIPNPH